MMCNIWHPFLNKSMAIRSKNICMRINAVCKYYTIVLGGVIVSNSTNCTYVQKYTYSFRLIIICAFSVLFQYRTIRTVNNFLRIFVCTYVRYVNNGQLQFFFKQVPVPYNCTILGQGFITLWRPISILFYMIFLRIWLKYLITK